jgi:hypothetical protein
MLKQPKREAYLKSSTGNYRYLFNWVGGGFNDIWARNLKEFRSKVKEQFPSLYREVNYSTLHKATPTLSKEWDRMGWMMTC